MTTKTSLEQVSEYYAASRDNWRNWLLANFEKEKRVWLIIYKKGSNIPSVSYEEAVEEALCFGWIDSKPNKRDQVSYLQFFAKRNPKSNWSHINKERVSKLIRKKLMTKAGLDAIKTAKENGAWDALDSLSKLIIPKELSAELKKNKKAKAYFEAFPPSVKKGILEWILNAKREETRKARIIETVELAANNIRANQYKGTRL